MKIRFTDKFYNVKMRGNTKELPDNIAKVLIKTGEVQEVKIRNTKN